MPPKSQRRRATPSRSKSGARTSSRTRSRSRSQPRARTQRGVYDTGLPKNVRRTTRRKHSTSVGTRKLFENPRPTHNGSRSMSEIQRMASEDVQAEGEGEAVVKCTSLLNAKAIMRAIPDPDELQATLLALGVPHDTIVNAYEKSGISGMAELMHGKCQQRVPRQTPETVARLSVDVLDLGKQQTLAGGQLLKKLLTAPAIQELIAFDSQAISQDADRQASLSDMNLKRTTIEANRVLLDKQANEKELDRRTAMLHQEQGNIDTSRRRELAEGIGEVAARVRKANDAIMTLNKLKEDAVALHQKRVQRQHMADNMLFLDTSRLEAIYARLYSDAKSATGEGTGPLGTEQINALTAYIQGQLHDPSNPNVKGAIAAGLTLMDNGLSVQRLIYDKTNRPMYIAMKADELGPMGKEVMLLRGLIKNMWKNSTRCAAVLSKHDVGRKESFDALIDYLSQGVEPDKEAEYKALLESIGPCLHDALFAVRVLMLDEMKDKIDEHGFIKTDDGSELAKKAFGDHSNIYLEKFVLTDEFGPAKAVYKDMIQAQLNRAKGIVPGTDKDSINTAQQLRREYDNFASMGTGYEVGDQPYLPEPIQKMLTMLRTGNDKNNDPARKDLIEKLKKTFYMLPGRKEYLSSYGNLSPTARQVLTLRRHIIQQVIYDLTTFSQHTICGDSVKRTVQKTKRKDGVLPPKEETIADKLAKRSRGLIKNPDIDVLDGPDTDPDTVQDEIYMNLFENVAKSLENDDENIGSDEQKTFALIRAMDRIFGISVDCTEMTKLPREQRLSAFENYFASLTTNAAVLIQQGNCEVSARTLDIVVESGNSAEMRRVREEIRPYAPLSLTDTILIAMGLPCYAMIQGKGKCDSVTRLVDRISEAETGPLKDAVSKFRKAISAIENNSSPMIANELHWEEYCVACIDASQVWRYIRYTFESASVYTQDEIMQHLSRGRFLISAKHMIGGNGITEENAALTVSIGGIRKSEDSSIKKLEQIKEEITKLTKSDNVENNLLDKIKPITGFPGMLKDKSRSFPVVIPPSIAEAGALHIGKLNPDMLRVGTEKTYGPENMPLVLSTLHRAFKQLITFAGALTTDDGELKSALPLGESIVRKQMEFVMAQAKHLCMLPLDACRKSAHCLVYNNTRCVIAGKQMQKETDEDGGKTIVWGDHVKFSKTMPREPQSGMSANHDVWQIGYEDIKDEFILASADDDRSKRILSHFTIAKILSAFEMFIGALNRKTINLLNGTNAAELFSNIAEKIKLRAAVMEKLRTELGCTDVYQTIEFTCKMVSDMLSSTDEENKNSELSQLPSTLYFILTGDPENNNPFKSRGMTYKGLGLPKMMAANIMCRLLEAVYSHFTEIRYLRCDLDKGSCLAAQKRNGFCKFEAGMCYNPILHEIKDNGLIKGGRLLGIVHRMLKEEYLDILANPRFAHPLSEHYGKRELLVALLGAEFVNTYPFLTPEHRLKQIQQKIDKRFSPKVLGGDNSSEKIAMDDLLDADFSADGGGSGGGFTTAPIGSNTILTATPAKPSGGGGDGGGGDDKYAAIQQLDELEKLEKKESQFDELERWGQS